MSRLTSGFLNRTKPAAPDIVGVPEVDQPASIDYDNEKHFKHGDHTTSHDGSSPERSAADSDGESFTSGAQQGVKAMEAVTTVWTKGTLAAALSFIVFLSFVGSMGQQMGFTLEPYLVSDFSALGLYATTGVVSQLVAGVGRLAVAKILDIWGRPQGFAVMILLVTIGLGMTAGTTSVEMYMGAQVFYWFGILGRDLCISVFLSDITSLKNRGFMFALETSPFIVTTWIGPPLGQAFLDSSLGYRWGYGAFAIIEPAVNIPLIALFMWYTRKARREGVLQKESSGRTTFQSIKHYAIEFDLVGIFLLGAGLAIFLLPFNIYSRQPRGWAEPFIIAMIVLGVFLIAMFAVWERYLAPVQFAPWWILTDRNVMGANVLLASTAMSFAIWASFMNPFVQIVYGLSPTEAGYVQNIYSIGSCITGVICGMLIRWSGRIKWLAAYVGLPLVILGVGMLNEFRQPSYNIGPNVVCQILIALGGGLIVICSQTAAMAAVTHQQIAVVLAIQALMFSVGQAIGYSISTPLWNEYFPTALARLLPPELQADAIAISGDLVMQQTYLAGSPARAAINEAYGIAMKYQTIAATAVLVLAIPAVLVWRDIKVKEFKQTKGKVW
ncbi:Putative major facilitator superfamily, MFS transporter superfamily [Septoria linicola]|uniref:Major facilitator superfamily, MFS transporter superfamily n=1 Tax=Septoria linicola TaxID=215465 RepID=A0A9Q9AXL9_9PEZI|nr:Putative major facilitator superfamily, MFS transporter superfamily [Septoria linicola]